jgi:cyclopropane fatty-acyl-phospholipid synthase-like methyltransferase
VSKQRRTAPRIVADGYDRIAERYAQWLQNEVVDHARPRYTQLLLDSVPPGSKLLELGCGGGGPTTRQLAERFTLTGVDLSAGQLELARRNVPGATFLHADMTTLAFEPESFDAVASFYALGHLPHGELPRLISRVATWLRPGGLFVASMGARPNPGDVEADWLGAPMYFSGYAPAENRRFVEEAGLEILSAKEETILENGQPTVFHWIVARKPA